MEELITNFRQLLTEGETEQILHFMQNHMLEAMVVVLAAGLITCFFGLKLIRVLSGIVGFFLGGALGMAVAAFIGVNNMVFLIISAVGAIAIAALASVIRRVGTFLWVLILMGGALGTALGSSMLMHLICAGISLLVAIIAVVFMDPIIIFISSVGGGALSAMAAMEIAGLGDRMVFVYILWAVLTVLGVVVQFMMKSREIGRKEKKFSQEVKEQSSMESEVEKARLILDDDSAFDDDEDLAEEDEQEDEETAQ